jgi:shikimate dehydrogenase
MAARPIRRFERTCDAAFDLGTARRHFIELNVAMTNQSISGRTKLLAILGDPLVNARTPTLANDILQARNRFGEFVLMPVQVAANDLPTAIAALRRIANFAGAVITMPHKSAVVSLLDEMTPEVRVVGAANVIRRDEAGRLIGTVLDGEGFVGGLLSHNHAVNEQHCLLLGAGGAASAIAYALLKHGCGSLTIHNRSQSKTEALAARLREVFPQRDIRTSTAVNEHYDIAINATSLGMHTTDALPLPPELMARCKLIAECVVTQDMTPLLKTAQAAGHPIHLGLHMLQAQMELLLTFMGAL